MFKYLSALLVTGLLNAIVHAQNSGLIIGDKMPDISMGKFLGDSSKNVNLSDINAKLIILDFWNTRCTTCLAGMPKMDSLQKKYANDIRIFAVTKNTREEVDHLFKKIKKKIPAIPFIVEDTIFNTLFPHNGDPLHVWINQKGVVVAITFHYNTNAETINEYLQGIDPHLSRRWDFGMNPDYDLISEQNSKLLGLATNYSALFAGTDEFTIDNYIRVDKQRVQLINATLLDLYGLAFNNEVYGFQVYNGSLRKNNRIIIETKDSAAFFPPKDEGDIAAWIKKNMYSYELKFPPEKDDLKYHYLQQDLQRYFPYRARVEKRKIRCLVLVSDSTSELLKTENCSDPALMKLDKDKSFIMHNMPISTLIAQLIYSNPDLNIPIIDATKIRYNIDIIIKSRLSDLQKVKKEFMHFGLQLIEEEIDVDMLVIGDGY